MYVCTPSWDVGPQIIHHTNGLEINLNIQHVICTSTYTYIHTQVYYTSTFMCTQYNKLCLQWTLMKLRLHDNLASYYLLCLQRRWTVCLYIYIHILYMRDLLALKLVVGVQLPQLTHLEKISDVCVVAQGTVWRNYNFQQRKRNQ